MLLSRRQQSSLPTNPVSSSVKPHACYRPLIDPCVFSNPSPSSAPLPSPRPTQILGSVDPIGSENTHFDLDSSALSSGVQCVEE
ncbi:hypothetical protein ACFX14_034143 [Malus domestica]